MRTLSRGIGAGLVSSGWLAGLSIVLAPIYVHLLGIEGYGLIGLYTAILSIGGLLDLALSATVSREIAWKQARAAEQHEIGPLLHSVEIVYWLVSSGLAVMLLIAAVVFDPDWIRASTLTDEQVEGALALMLLSLAIQLPGGLYSASLIGLHRQAHCAVLLAGFGTLRGVGAALFTWGLSNDIRAFFLFYVVVNLIQLIWLRWQTWSYVKAQGGQPFFAVKYLRSIRQGAGAMFLITAMGMMLSQIDKIVLTFLVPLESLGHYTLAWALASGLTIIATPVVQGFGARFSALVSTYGDREFENQLNIASQLTYALVIPLAVTISLFAKSIMVAWVRDADVASASASATLLPLLALGTAMMACTYPLLIALYAKKEYKPALLVQFFFLLLFFPLLLWLVNSLGVLGAALSWSIYGVSVFATYFILTAVRYGSRLFLGLFRAFISITVTSFIVVWLIMQFLGLVESEVLVLLVMGLALAGGWLLSVSVCPDLRHALGNLLKAV